MRLVFLGTPSFAVPSLLKLADAGHQIVAVYTQPDRPKGRGGASAPSPVKCAALDLGLFVLQPERLRRPENLPVLQGFAAELMVVVGYGQIIPQTIIDLPRHGILNVHASLLPKYRGAAPIQWAIANGENKTGVTIMQIDAGLDTGDMLRKAELEIGASETAPELSERLSSTGAELLLQVVAEMAEGAALVREKQNETEATLAPILKKEDGAIAWERSAFVIDARRRGFTPWPGAYTVFRNQQLSLGATLPLPMAEYGAPGTLHKQGRRLLVACGEGTTLEILDLQLAGKKRMTAEAFLNGYPLSPEERLGAPQ